MNPHLPSLSLQNGVGTDGGTVNEVAYLAHRLPYLYYREFIQYIGLTLWYGLYGKALPL